MFRYCAIGLSSLACTSAALAALNPNNVLVIYNSQNTDSLAVSNYYQTVRPGVLSFDLNDATLAAGNISYTDYETKIRDKVRNYLNTNNLQQQVSVLTLTKGLPHRILDVNNGTVGDSPFAAETQLMTNANATYSSVDSELVYLQQNLRTGEANGAMDSHADNFIINPYFNSSASITSFNRSTVTSAISFNANSDAQPSGPPLQYWDDNQPSAAGRIYLTARLDGNNFTDVKNMIDKAQNINLNKTTDRLIIDDQTFNFDGNDFENTNTLLSSTWSNISYDNSSTFYIGVTGTISDLNKQAVSGPIALLTTYGQNSTPSNTTDQAGYISTFNGQLVNGAIFNSYESYNGRGFGGLGTLFGQGQINEFLAAGGTLAEGNVWEPFTFGVPLNQPMLNNFYNNGLTWVEAAWSGQLTASWQTVVIGDPLAVVPEPGAIGVLGLLGVCLLRRSKI